MCHRSGLQLNNYQFICYIRIRKKNITKKKNRKYLMEEHAHLDRSKNIEVNEIVCIHRKIHDTLNAFFSK